jgi:hypothetical protein
MSKILPFVMDRLKEKSTWATLLTIGGMIAGFEFSPEQSERITVAGMAILGAIGVFVNENKSE